MRVGAKSSWVSIQTRPTPKGLRHPFGSGGAYMNFMMEEGEDRIRAAYRDNYDRLAKIKARYDPANVFRINQNIKPTVQSELDAALP